MSETVFILQLRRGKTVMISIRRNDSGVGSASYKGSGGNFAGYPGNDASSMTAPGRRVPTTTYAMKIDTVVVVVYVGHAVSLRFPHTDPTCLAMLTRLQPDVLIFARCQSYCGGESADAQLLLLSRDHWPLVATCRTASSGRFSEPGITLQVELAMIIPI